MSICFDQQLVQRIRAEYIEMPGMKLTIDQVRRLCGVEVHLCKLLLQSLVEARFLSLDSDGSYARLTESPLALPCVAKAKLILRQLPEMSRRAC
jgi:hypothetical protein